MSRAKQEMEKGVDSCARLRKHLLKFLFLFSGQLILGYLLVSLGKVVLKIPAILREIKKGNLVSVCLRDLVNGALGVPTG